MASAAAAVLAVAMIGPADAETNDDRISDCMHAGYRPGSGMFAVCAQPEESSGLGMLDSPQFAPERAQSALPLPPMDGPSPYGAPDLLLDAPDTEAILYGADPADSPVWDWRR